MLSSRRAGICVALVILVAAVFPAWSQEAKSIQLMAPQVSGGRLLMQALQDRKSSREFAPDKLPIEVLSNLCWAAFGINRPENEHRTAPSAMNMQEIDIYAAMADGLYKYEPRTHQLVFIHKEDVRTLTGRQDFVAQAPLNLVYVADFSRMGKTPPEQRDFYSATDTGFISQNVYLYCASEGLATVVRGLIDRGALAKALRLRSDQKPVLAQTVGYPKKS